MNIYGTTRTGQAVLNGQNEQKAHKEMSCNMSISNQNGRIAVMAGMAQILGRLCSIQSNTKTISNHNGRMAVMAGMAQMVDRLCSIQRNTKTISNHNGRMAVMARMAQMVGRLCSIQSGETAASRSLQSGMVKQYSQCGNGQVLRVAVDISGFISADRHSIVYNVGPPVML